MYPDLKIISWYLHWSKEFENFLVWFYTGKHSHGFQLMCHWHLFLFLVAHKWYPDGLVVSFCRPQSSSYCNTIFCTTIWGELTSFSPHSNPYYYTLFSTSITILCDRMIIPLLGQWAYNHPASRWLERVCYLNEHYVARWVETREYHQWFSRFGLVCIGFVRIGMYWISGFVFEAKYIPNTYIVCIEFVLYLYCVCMLYCVSIVYWSVLRVFTSSSNHMY